MLYKAKDIPANIHDGIQNVPPQFDSVNTQRNVYDFHFTQYPDSSAVNVGIITPYPTDLEGKIRDALPDLGGYEL